MAGRLLHTFDPLKPTIHPRLPFSIPSPLSASHHLRSVKQQQTFSMHSDKHTHRITHSLSCHTHFSLSASPSLHPFSLHTSVTFKPNHRTANPWVLDRRLASGGPPEVTHRASVEASLDKSGEGAAEYFVLFKVGKHMTAIPVEHWLSYKAVRCVCITQGWAEVNKQAHQHCLAAMEKGGRRLVQQC